MTKEIDNIQDKINWHWRATMHPVRFFGFDARAALPIPLLLVYARWSTVGLTILSLILFRIVERQGLSFSAAIRTFRSWIVGKERPGWIGVSQKKFTDFE